MKSTLILPTEECVDEFTLKRALLHYEKVYLKHPEDRDFVPGTDLLSIVANAPGMSMGGAGFAKPLGKEKDHDEIFERLLESFKPAIKEGSLIVMDKPTELYHQGVGMGYHIPDEHRAVYWNYRNMLASEDFINAASKGISSVILNENVFDDLAPAGGDDTVRHTDERLNNKIPYLGKTESEDEKTILTRMVHARIASISRNLMVCHINNLVPFTTNIGYSSVLKQMQYNWTKIVEAANDGSVELTDLDLVGKIENLVFSDFLDKVKIDALSVKQILDRRTKMWGDYCINKSYLEETLLKIALDSKDQKEFEKKVADLFTKFLKDNRDYMNERGNLGFKIACNIGTIATTSTLGPALLQSFITASSLGLLMMLACPATFLLAEKRIPEIRNVLKQNNELKRLPIYDLYNYYKPLL